MSSVSAINPLVAFYDIHGRKRQVFFYFVTDTTRYYTLLFTETRDFVLYYVMIIALSSKFFINIIGFCCRELEITIEKLRA
jgi:hypothetical protein